MVRYTLADVIKAYNSGSKMKYLFFWGHQKNANGVITSSCFSQWWIQKFTVEGVEYPSTEHYMMAEKARLFGDTDIVAQVLQASFPGNAKQLGRLVKGFDHSVWEAHRMNIVVKGNYHKFS